MTIHEPAPPPHPGAIITPSGPGGNPGLPRFVTVIIGVAATLLVIVLLRQFSGVVGPVFLAINLVIAAYPIFSWLRGKGTPGWLSAAVMFLAVTVMLLAAVAGLVWAVSAMVNQLPSYSAQWTALYNAVINWLAGFDINTTGMSDLLRQISPGSVVSMLSTAFSYTTAITGIVATVILSLIFMAMDTPGMRARVRVVATEYPRLSESMTHFSSSVRTYWVAATVFGAIVAVLDGLALWILGVPLAVVWAMLAFLTNYIPNIGFFIGLIPPVLLALLGGGWQLALAVVVVYAVLNTVIQTVIQPRIVGESIGVMTTVSFVSLLLWGFVLGPVGTLIAVPMTLLLKALFIDADPKAAWLGAFISSNKAQAKKAKLPKGLTHAVK